MIGEKEEGDAEDTAVEMESHTAGDAVSVAPASIRNTRGLFLIASHVRTRIYEEALTTLRCLSYPRHPANEQRERADGLLNEWGS